MSSEFKNRQGKSCLFFKQDPCAVEFFELFHLIESNVTQFFKSSEDAESAMLKSPLPLCCNVSTFLSHLRDIYFHNACLHK